MGNLMSVEYSKETYSEYMKFINQKFICRLRSLVYDIIIIIILAFRSSMRSDFDGVDFTLDGVFGSFGLLGLAWLASVTV